MQEEILEILKQDNRAYSVDELNDLLGLNSLDQFKQLLKDLGIQHIGKTMFDGIVFSGEKFRKIVSFPDKGHFNIKFLDNNYTYRVAHELDVYGSKNKYLSTIISYKEN